LQRRSRAGGSCLSPRRIPCRQVLLPDREGERPLVPGPILLQNGRIMALRRNHYDVAFEELLRQLRRPYVSVNETRRSLTRDTSLKSMDFIVYSPHDCNLLIDVKGRRLPGGCRSWDNWATADDIHSLMKWEQVFGERFRALLLFAYDVTAPRAISQHALTWEIAGRRYAFYGVWARDYQSAMYCFSPRWETVALPAREFERLRRPLFEVL